MAQGVDGLAVNWPLVQAMHDEALPRLYDPEGQFVQELMGPTPDMVPAGHAWQGVAVLDVNVPLPHAMHAVLASVLYEPL